MAKPVKQISMLTPAIIGIHIIFQVIYKVSLQFHVENISGASSDLCTIVDTTYTAGNGIIITGTQINASASICGAGDFTTYNGSEFLCDTPSGSGDIQSVNGSGPYLYGYTGSGDAIIYFNETVLNATIDARSISGYQSSAAGWENDSSSTNTTLDVKVGGNIGIGGSNPTPSFPLNVQGSAFISNTLIVPNGPIRGSTEDESTPSFSFNDDPDTGMFGNVNGFDTIGFSVGTSQIAMFNSNGLGIGTNSPSSNLDINLTNAADIGLIIRKDSSQTANLFELQNSTGGLLSYFTANGDLYIGDTRIYEYVPTILRIDDTVWFDGKLENSGGGAFFSIQDEGATHTNPIYTQRSYQSTGLGFSQNNVTLVSNSIEKLRAVDGAGVHIKGVSNQNITEWYNGSSDIVAHIDTTGKFTASEIVSEGDVTGTEFVGTLNWIRLFNYPSACPSGSFVTQLEDSITCTALTQDSYFTYSGYVLGMNETTLNATIDARSISGYQSSAAGWTNTTVEVSTSLNVNVTDGNLTIGGLTRVWNGSCEVTYINGVQGGAIC
jgi:hypothetical protein